MPKLNSIIKVKKSIVRPFFPKEKNHSKET